MNLRRFITLTSNFRSSTLTATTVGVNQTVTLDRITPTGKDITVNWGDGQTSVIVNGNIDATTHVYAAAGVYPINITNPEVIISVDLRDTQLGGLNTAQLRNNVLNIFRVSGITNSIIRSSDMVAWRPVDWFLTDMPASGTYIINTVDMVAWRPDNWLYSNIPAGTYVINSSDMSAWRPTYWRCMSMPAGTYVINSSDISAWRPSYWYLTEIPIANTTWTLAAVDFAGWITPDDIQLWNNALNQAQVDAILNGLWLAFPTKTSVASTINIGGSNSAPSGTLQAANPPTTGKEFAYELVHDSQNINPTKKWSSVTITA